MPFLAFYSTHFQCRLILFCEKCETLLEEHEQDIENWYFKHQDQPLQKYLCIDRALKRGDAGCLSDAIEDKSENKKDEL